MTINRLPAVVLLTAALLISAACSSDDSDDGATSSTTEPTAQLIEYDQDEPTGRNLTKAADVSKLEGAPDDFKQFIAGILDASRAESANECKVAVGVAKIDTSGFAAGSIRSCGGAVYIWAKRDGIWQEIWSGQELPDCADIEKYSVPKPIAGDSCYDGKKNKVDYTP